MVERHALDELCVNTIRFLAVDAVEQAKSGHPGLPMGAAPMAYVLWTRFLKHNPANPSWFDRDRFVLSAGHGSMLLYALLHLSGYDLPLSEIRRFRQWGSRAPGHPERGVTPGVETTTGPLGQGFANGVGMAIAERFLAARYNRPGFPVVDHYTYGLVSDGDLMEGVAAESASLAGHLKLGKLIYLYDDNRTSLAGSTALCFSEDRAHRFAAYGWHTVTVGDGRDLEAIEEALLEARAESERPSLILVRTEIGYGSPNLQGSYEAHGAPLGPNETRLAKANLGWPEEPAFYIPPSALEHFRLALTEGGMAEASWQQNVRAYADAYPDLADELVRILDGIMSPDWETDIPSFAADPKGLSTRDASGQVLRAIAGRVPNLLGGSADMNPSTRTLLQGAGDFQHPDTAAGDIQGAAGGTWSYAGRNVHCGVREHAMAAISNGLAVHGGLIPFAATFLTFVDYMQPAVRLAAIMQAHVIFVFTHDSVAVGEDGPTHQPVEQLASLRAVPGLVTIRPCDASEAAIAWRVAMEAKGPVVLLFSRQALPILDRKIYLSEDGLRRGAYVLKEASSSPPGVILVATGSEVHLATQAHQKLEEVGVATRVVSMPSWELFEAQSETYREAVFPANVSRRLAIEAGVSQGWRKYVGDKGDILAIDHFGASAPGPVVLQEFGFTVDHVLARALRLVGKGQEGMPSRKDAG